MEKNYLIKITSQLTVFHTKALLKRTAQGILHYGRKHCQDHQHHTNIELHLHLAQLKLQASFWAVLSFTMLSLNHVQAKSPWTR